MTPAPPAPHRQRAPPAPITLVRPRAGEAFRFSAQSLAPPLGLACLAAALEAAGHAVCVVDAVGRAPSRHTRYFKGYLVGAPDDEVVAALPADARIVGVSVIFTHEWPAAVTLIAAIRAARPDATIVLGGEHATALPEFCLATSAADIVVRGEGEATLVELVAALTAARARGVGPHLDGVAGLVFRGADGEFVTTAPRARITDVDALPRPAWHHVDLAAYHGQRYVGGVYTGRLSVPILATRGCPYRCTYCTNPGMWGTAWVARDPVKVVDEIEHWVAAYGAGNFPFQDLTAIIRKDWIVAFCTELIARALDIRWQLPTGTRAEAVDAEVAELLRRSGMIGMAYAPESGSEDVRRAIQKRMRTDALLDSVTAAADADLNVAIFLVLGFPEDTPASLAETLALVDRLVDAGAIEVSLGYYMHLPGTEQFERQLAAAEAAAGTSHASPLRLDRRYFGHILQNTELLPSVSFCPALSRPALAWWTLRIYGRFFWLNFRASRRRRRPSTLVRGVSGAFGERRRRDGAKLPHALRFAAVSLGNTLRARLGPRWLPARDERDLLAGWDAALHATRATTASPAARD